LGAPLFLHPDTHWTLNSTINCDIAILKDNEVYWKFLDGRVGRLPSTPDNKRNSGVKGGEEKLHLLWLNWINEKTSSNSRHDKETAYAGGRNTSEQTQAPFEFTQHESPDKLPHVAAIGPMGATPKLFARVPSPLAKAANLCLAAKNS